MWGKNMNELKLGTCLAWIDCLQCHKSPIDTLIQREIKEVIVYGIADLGKRFINEAICKGYPIKAITDVKVLRGNYDYRAIPLIRRDDLTLDEYKDVCVVVTSMTFWDEIKEQLEGLGIGNVVSLLELMEL